MTFVTATEIVEPLMSYTLGVSTKQTGSVEIMSSIVRESYFVRVFVIV